MTQLQESDKKKRTYIFSSGQEPGITGVKLMEDRRKT